MKKFSLLMLSLFTAALVFAQTAPLEFKETRFSFGKVKQHVPVSHVFMFKNVSERPVVIESAVAGCGCTTPEYPKGAIAKGATNSIKVTYNSEALNAFTKQVTIKLANVAEPIILTIDGEVVAADASTSANTKKSTAANP